ncbi:hypothetical protein BXZ70DRAFT_785762 [Cristinia sonorae]|uniref:Uncharacterized protein n=1 Tax=Cristinia sonorae TaxID=1940300 RepID=A0A8K0USL6_9AGAR|nr:hypothetical protein BXZ70DRAFT_785762 [Cristinia sonorae]
MAMIPLAASLAAFCQSSSRQPLDRFNELITQGHHTVHSVLVVPLHDVILVLVSGDANVPPGRSSIHVSIHLRSLQPEVHIPIQLLLLVRPPARTFHSRIATRSLVSDYSSCSGCATSPPQMRCCTDDLRRRKLHSPVPPCSPPTRPRPHHSARPADAYRRFATASHLRGPSSCLPTIVLVLDGSTDLTRNVSLILHL